MPRKHLTDVVCQTVTTKAQTRYWDTTMQGFGLTVGPLSKTFVVMVGKRRQLITIGKYPGISLTTARREAHRILGTHVVAETVTFAEARADFIELHCQRNNRPRTAAEIARLLNRIDFPGRLDRISRRDIQSAIASFPPSVANHTLTALKTMFNWCVEQGMVATTPLLRAKLPHQLKPRSRTLADEELARLWAGTDELRTFGRIVQLCILLGARRGEVAGIQPGWIQGDTLIIPAENSKNKRQHSCHSRRNPSLFSKPAPFPRTRGTRTK